MKINKKNAFKLWEKHYGDARFAEDFHGYLMCRDGYVNIPVLVSMLSGS